MSNVKVEAKKMIDKDLRNADEGKSYQIMLYRRDSLVNKS